MELGERNWVRGVILYGCVCGVTRLIGVLLVIMLFYLNELNFYNSMSDTHIRKYLPYVLFGEQWFS